MPAGRSGGPVLGFDRPVPRDGYAWWYVDALSDDGRYGLTIIAFIGSVFSPYYAWARKRGRGEPTEFCSLNVVLHGPGAERWTMTERGASALERTATSYAIGPSAVRWDGTTLTIDIDEVTVPIPGRVRGTVRVHPIMVTDHVVTLDAAGRHRWWPVAPASRVEVDLASPSLRWSGPGYFDSNWGDAPLEADFPDWDWCRTALGPGGREGAAILYDVRRRDGTGKTVPIHVRPDGSVEPFAAPPRVRLPATRIWRVPRETGCEAGGEARVAATFLDAPFYARSVVTTRLLGRPVTAMHESLALDRFASPWVQVLLPFRMPRVAR